VNIENSSRLKEIRVAKAVKDCDALINLPRLKSHVEATITGAIKNFWGIIPGGLKANYHLYGKNVEQFGEVLADNYSWIVNNKPNRLTVYDLQEIMEGPTGPGSGIMKQWDLILAGTDELALDIIALEIGKVKVKYIPHVTNAIERNLGVGELKNIEIRGLSLEEAKARVPKFRVPGSKFTSFIAYMSGHIGYKIMKKIPVLKKENCVQCGQCAQICPAKAIEFEAERFPITNRKKCISCMCCMELCPENAIEAKNRGLAGLFD
jgi:ferredoxin